MEKVQLMGYFRLKMLKNGLIDPEEFKEMTNGQIALWSRLLCIHRPDSRQWRSSMDLCVWKMKPPAGFDAVEKSICISFITAGVKIVLETERFCTQAKILQNAVENTARKISGTAPGQGA
ncbi:unnamed protein product, partial [Mesorhabditis spiculigera]